jgi:hypothetical protein
MALAEVTLSLAGQPRAIHSVYTLTYIDLMAETLSREPNRNRRALRTRFIWFVAGAGVSYLLISTPFHWLKKHTALSTFEVSACSLAVSTVFFFVWNYFINFRTNARKRDALPRYILAVGIMWLLSSGTLTVLEHSQLLFPLMIGTFKLDLNIVATQFVLSGLKFYLYHKWVFPVPKEP